MQRILFVIIFIVFLFLTPALAQNVTVSPSDVNAYSQGATTVFLTFGNVVNVRPAESTWCGEIISAAPDLGFKCDPTTIFGQLPARYDQSRLSGTNGYTDIMSITPSVARRAYLDAVRGSDARFFYVRRFASTVSGPDEYVPITIRLSGNGARVPFSLTDVKLLWDGGKKVIPFIKTDEKLPRISAEIKYTGTGRLKGRWEIVKPGESLPEQRDLLTEATLPIEERGTQRHYTLLSRFNVYLPPGGKYTLPGPENWRVEKHVEGMYLILLRIEATDDGENQSDLASIGVGGGTVKSGGVAGFTMPVLRYYVGAGTGSQNVPANSSANDDSDTFLMDFTALTPEDNAIVDKEKIAIFGWTRFEQAALYRLEIENEKGETILSAILPAEKRIYRAPSWLKEKAKVVRWRVIALKEDGSKLGETKQRVLTLDQAK
jgi:hypothetical protein